MKKVLICLVGAFLSFAFLPKANALTFEEVSNKYKEKYDYSKIDEVMGSIFNNLEDMATVNTSSNKITITTKNEDLTFTTTFNYNNNLITYKYSGPKEMSEATTMRMLSETAYVSKLLYIVAELKGYSYSDILHYFGDVDETDFTMAKHGLEVTTFTISQNADNAQVSMSSIDTLTLDINKFNLEGNSTNNSINNAPSQNPNNSNTNNNVNNPQTGYGIYLIGFSILALLILLSLFRTKKPIKKL